MRTLASSASLGLALALLTGCTDTPLVPPASDVAPAGPSMTETFNGVQVERARLDLAGWADETTSIPVHLVTPAAAENIGTGSAIIIRIPNEGRFGCTANFVWAAKGKRYLGAAGHCFVPSASTSTHGPGADYDASGVTVDVCVDNCEGNFRSNLLLGTWVRLGNVAYARQQDASGEGVGNDFGVVEIPKEFRDYVRLTMPVWGGPTSAAQTLNMGDNGCHYGHGLLVGETVATKARVGVGGGSEPDYWTGDFAGAFGDSGSGLVACTSDGLGFHGTGAVGVLTHLGVEASTSGEHGVIFGTTVNRAVEMAQEAGLSLSLVLPKK